MADRKMTHMTEVAGESATSHVGVVLTQPSNFKYPPPSRPDGRNVDGLKRRMRRAGRSSPRQYRDLTGRRVFTSSCGGILHCRNLLVCRPHFAWLFKNNRNNFKKQLLDLPRTTVRGCKNAAWLRGVKMSCFYKLLELFPFELTGKNMNNLPHG